MDKNDLAFQNPTKPIGSFMDEAEAKRRAATEGWNVVEDAGRGWRCVVPSPLPKRVIERDAVKELLDAGFVVITVGGGGIPVVEDEDGRLVGTAAVIDGLCLVAAGTKHRRRSVSHFHCCRKSQPQLRQAESDGPGSDDGGRGKGIYGGRPLCAGQYVA